MNRTNVGINVYVLTFSDFSNDDFKDIKRFISICKQALSANSSFIFSLEDVSSTKKYNMSRTSFLQKNIQTKSC